MQGWGAEGGDLKPRTVRQIRAVGPVDCFVADRAVCGVALALRYGGEGGTAPCDGPAGRAWRTASAAPSAACLVADRTQQRGLDVIALALPQAGEPGRRTARGGSSGRQRTGGGVLGGRLRRGRDLAEEVAEQAAGAVDRGAVGRQAAQDVGADGGGGVSGGEPAGGEVRQLVVHAPGDAAEVGGEVGEGGDEDAGLVGGGGSGLGSGSGSA